MKRHGGIEVYIYTSLSLLRVRFRVSLEWVPVVTFAGKDREGDSVEYVVFSLASFSFFGRGERFRPLHHEYDGGTGNPVMNKRCDERLFFVVSCCLFPQKKDKMCAETQIKKRLIFGLVALDRKKKKKGNCNKYYQYFSSSSL